MRIHVHRETAPGERRVALVPRSVSTLTDDGHQVVVLSGAGLHAGVDDSDYESAGATIASGDPGRADLVVGVGPLRIDEVGDTGAVMGFLDPLGSPEEMARFAAAGITALAMELVPRTTQAQVMDALSSQATVAGYEAVLLAASTIPRLLPMLMTAAGTIAPSKVLVLGTGVAGLQAIATARRLGAVTAGYDIRPVAREQVESLGATFVGGPVEEAAETSGGYASEVDEETRRRQTEALAHHVMAADIVITTAQVPGRRAPILVTRDMVAGMKRGAVVVDLAAPGGGNCELTVAGETVEVHGVKVIGPMDLASRGAAHASEMYSRNVTALIRHLATDDGDLAVDPDDEIAVAVCVTRDGKIAEERVAAAAEGRS